STNGSPRRISRMGGQKTRTAADFAARARPIDEERRDDPDATTAMKSGRNDISASSSSGLDGSCGGVALAVCRRRRAAETEAIDSIAQGRAFDLQQLRGAGLVAVADPQRPADQIGLQLAQSVVERDGGSLVRKRRSLHGHLRGLRPGAEQDARRYT